MTSERTFTEHEISVWHEYFGEYDMREILELKRQYSRASRNVLKPTKTQRDAMRVWTYFLKTLRTGTVHSLKVSAKDQIEQILETSNHFEIAQIDASRSAIFKAVVDINRKLKNGTKLKSYYANGRTKRNKRAESVVGYRLIGTMEIIEADDVCDESSFDNRLSKTDTKSALYNKVYEHFSKIGKSTLRANDLAAFNNQSVVVHVIEDLGYRFNHDSANWRLRKSA